MKRARLFCGATVGQAAHNPDVHEYLLGRSTKFAKEYAEALTAIAAKVAQYVKKAI